MADVGHPPPQYTFTGSNNRIDGWQYDAAGNVLVDPVLSNSYTYDAEGRVYQVNGGSTATYYYDAFGKRIKGPDFEYTYDVNGKPATLLNPTTDAVLSTQIYAGNRLLSAYYGSGTFFPHVDHLGTLRARTNASGTVCQTTVSLPYGDNRSSSGTCYDSLVTSVAGMEYDSGTKLNHTLFRQYYNTPGRWMTPDPAGSAEADIKNPQSWNSYSYATDNPISFVDPLGLDTVPCPEGTTEGTICFDHGELLGDDDDDEGGLGPGPALGPTGFVPLVSVIGGGGGDDRDRRTAVPPPPSNPKSCSDQLKDMRNLVDAVRINSGDPKGLAQRFGQILKGGNTTNIMEFQNRQRQLQHKIDDYRNSGCGDPPPEIDAWATLPAASPWAPPGQHNSSVPSWVIPAAVVTGGACAILVPGCLEVEAGTLLIP